MHFNIKAGLFAVASALTFASSAVADDKPTFTIGAILSTTGPAAALGVPEEHALRLLRDTLEASGDLPFNLRFVMYDDKTDPTEAVNLTRKLIEEDVAHVVICCTTTPASMAILDVVNEHKTPMISMASGSTIIEPASERYWTFKTTPSERLMFVRVFDHMRAKGIKTLAFAGNQDSYGESGWNVFKEMAVAEEFEVVSDVWFARGDSNLTPQALRAKAATPDAVYIHAIPPSTNLMHQALNRVGFDGDVYHGAGAANNAFLSIADGEADGGYVGVGAVLVANQLPDDFPLNAVLRDFTTLYEAEFGAGKADMFSVSGWDAGRVAVHAVGKVATADGASTELGAQRQGIRDAIETTTGFETTSGVFNFSAEDHLGLDSSALMVATVKDGKFHLED
ncbi:ABC transporter substrate-binding protein [Epibacterium sp. Ofav1-8]|uniref:ABC transporter substrate-binding protein n=1 Tax=Epibacterium sp. Ofav1-8 TaxID=2917735 RepID=UPI001EF5D251|nr:ABC transporter substrate-binding protein [Epibacterium sp. Ofav1-8]MCG7625159.1 ABC transporter substrate-binding protein [Epibacterium sp. Ofav1-8]